VQLVGDVLFCSNTDEESSGAGSWSAVERGVSADAGICAEPTGFNAWTACRGAQTVVIKVEGRAGHAEVPQPHWVSGGAVNAIEKAVPLLASIERLRNEWRVRPDQLHPLLSPGGILPTVIRGGTWIVTYPESCEFICDVEYLPGQVDDQGMGELVRQEVMQWVNTVAASDPWLAQHPPEWQWIADVPPAEISSEHGIVTTVLACASDLGRAGAIAGLDAWHDAATFTLLGGTPTVSFGPGGLESAHAVDEYVPVRDLVDHCAAVALAIMRWCGINE
jgi:acetylornithine deacetylase